MVCSSKQAACPHFHLEPAIQPIIDYGEEPEEIFECTQCKKAFRAAGIWQAKRKARQDYLYNLYLQEKA